MIKKLKKWHLTLKIVESISKSTINECLYLSITDIKTEIINVEIQYKYIIKAVNPIIYRFLNYPFSHNYSGYT